MHLKALSGKCAQLSRARMSLWRPFISGWWRRQQTQLVPCVVKDCNRLLYVPLRDFYECYHYFCEVPQGYNELAHFLGRLRAAEIFYDIGAFRAAFSVMTKMKLQDRASIHAFEPLPKNVESIRRICRINGFEDFKVIPFAVSDGHILEGGVHKDDSMFELAGVRSATVKTIFPAVSLDEYIAAGAVPPSVIKIDVEGFEFRVLRGAHQCLIKHRPRLWLEIHPVYLRAQQETPDELLEFLKKIGYAVSFYNDYQPENPERGYHIWCQ